MRRLAPLVSAMALSLGPVIALHPATALAQAYVDVQVDFGPPPLPVYVQPPLPGPDYVWIPGYWAWDDDVGDYYWVPGTWVLAPRPGLLWTPAWWGWDDGAYLFHPGYWGEHVGFYGGVHYGFGYNGAGYEGGYWNGGHFFYNTTVNHITNVSITNVYQKTVIVNNVTRVSYNGGPGGVQARPTTAQLAAFREPRFQPTPMQMQHVRAAQGDRSLFATANHGAPPVAAAALPGRLAGPGVVRAQAPGGPLPRPLQNGPVGRGPGPQRPPAGQSSWRPGPGPGAPSYREQPYRAPPPREPAAGYYNPGGPMQRPERPGGYPAPGEGRAPGGAPALREGPWEGPRPPRGPEPGAEYRALPPRGPAPGAEYRAPPPRGPAPGAEYRAPPPRGPAPGAEYRAPPPRGPAPGAEYRAPPPRGPAPGAEYRAAPPPRPPAPAARPAPHPPQDKRPDEH